MMYVSYETRKELKISVGQQSGKCRKGKNYRTCQKKVNYIFGNEKRKYTKNYQKIQKSTYTKNGSRQLFQNINVNRKGYKKQVSS